MSARALGFVLVPPLQRDLAGGGGARHLKQPLPGRDGLGLEIVRPRAGLRPAAPLFLSASPRLSGSRGRRGASLCLLGGRRRWRRGVLRGVVTCLGRLLGVQLEVVIQLLEQKELAASLDRTLDVLQVLAGPGAAVGDVVFQGGWRLLFGMQCFQVLLNGASAVGWGRAGMDGVDGGAALQTGAQRTYKQHIVLTPLVFPAAERALDRPVFGHVVWRCGSTSRPLSTEYVFLWLSEAVVCQARNSERPSIAARLGHSPAVKTR